MFVGVIVSKTAKQVDRIFDYSVPKRLCGEMHIGRRVIVPFGVRSMLCEGYVFELKSHTDAKRLKDIAGTADGEDAFDEKGAQLIAWLREKTLCSYIEAVRLLMPTGTRTDFEKWVCLTENGAEDFFGMISLQNSAGTKKQEEADIRRRIVEILENEHGEAEEKKLELMCGMPIRAHITALEKAGVVKTFQRSKVDIKTRTVRFAKLCIDKGEAQRMAEKLYSRAPKQAEIIDLLCTKEHAAVSDLLQTASAGHAALVSLEKKGVVRLYDEEVMRDPAAEEKSEKNQKREGFKELTAEQERAKKTLCASMDSGKSETFLIHGVTGSGKTEVYMHVIEHALSQGKTAIVLVPEISLTPLMTKRFVTRFGESVAILHSGLSLGERYDEWRRIKHGGARVVVGARSAVFAPLDNIGVIILDEEHEYTYKSEMSPKYHARDAAMFRAGQHGAVCVLASATPSIESYYKAKTGEYGLIEMNTRYNSQKLPTVYVTDMREELEKGNRTMFGDMLSHELLYNIEHGQQSILFLNRRGFSTFVSCRSCGYVAKCPHCNISMTYHRYTNRLMCHYCGYTHENYSVCPECGSKYIKYFGAGTQKLEEELKKKFEGVSTVRMDFDTTNTKSAHKKLLEKFEKEKTDVLIGTQMVSKGLDFHNVTLVGVIAADSSLYTDDYRSGERTFDLIMQVCGRAGRGDMEGRAIVQTYTPEHSAVVHAKNHDYKGFYEEEIQLRRAMNYPPFCEIVTVLFSGKDERMTGLYAEKYASQIRKMLDKCAQKTLLLGPAASSVSKIKDKYRYRIIIKCECADGLNDILRNMQDNMQKDENSRFVSISVDKNPNSTA